VPMSEFGGPAAVTYIVTGGGGAELYAAGRGYWTAFSASTYHYVRASVSDCTLQIQAVDTNGSVFDQYSINRCGG